MDPKPNYSECVEIETARCEVRDGCIGDPSFDKSYPVFDTATCLTYAKEHCRTRKIGGEGWDQADVEACTTAIENLPCAALIPRGIDETESIAGDPCWFIDVPSTDEEPADGGAALTAESSSLDAGA